MPHYMKHWELAILFTVFASGNLSSSVLGLQPNLVKDTEKKNNEDENKTLGCVIGTKYTYSSNSGYIDRNLRRIISSFAAPESSADIPVDFLLNATIVPKDWGKVCDIKRAPNRSIKILTVREFNIDNWSLTKKMRLVMKPIDNFYKMLFSLGGLASIAPLMAWKGKTRSSFYNFAQWISLSSAAVAFVGITDTTPCAVLELSIYDLTTKAKESSIIIRQSELQEPMRMAYFLDSTLNNMIVELSDTTGSSIKTFRAPPPKTGVIHKLQLITTPQDLISKGIRILKKRLLKEDVWHQFDAIRDILSTANKAILDKATFDPTTLTNIDWQTILAIRHGAHKCVLHAHPEYFQKQLVAQNLMRLANITHGVFLIKDKLLQVRRDGENLKFEKRIQLPACMIYGKRFCARMKTSDSSLVLLESNFRNSKPYYVIVDLEKTYNKSPQLKIMVKAIIESGSSIGFDTLGGSKYSLYTFGQSWGERLLENLRFFYGIDKGKIKSETVRAKNVKNQKTRTISLSLCAASVALSIGGFLYSKFGLQKNV